MVSERFIRAKVVILGDLAVGKTTLAKSYLGGRPISEITYKPTIGVDLYVKEDTYDVKPFGPTRIAWDIWDLSGQKAFKDICGVFLRGALCGIIIFDVSREETLRSVPTWAEHFVKHAGKRPVILVGNKIDLRGREIKCVPKESGEEYADKISEIIGVKVPYVETSALYNINVRETFERLAINLLEHMLSEEE